MPLLIVHQDSENYRIITFDDDITIGRDEENDVVLPLPLVSRRHACIHKQDDGSFLLVDNGSTNSIWHGSDKIDNIRLEHGYSFRITSYYCTFLENAENRKSKIKLPGTSLTHENGSSTILWGLDAYRPPTSPRITAGTGDSSAVWERTLQLQISIHALQSATEEDELLYALVKEAVDLTGAERGFLALFDKSGDLIHNTAVDFDVKREASSIRHDLIQKALTVKRSIHHAPGTGTVHTQAGSSQQAGRPVLCAPLVCQQDLLGIIYLDKKAGDSPFTDIDERLSELLSLYGAVLLVNFRNKRKAMIEQNKVRQHATTREKTVFRSQVMKKLFRDIRTIAPINIPVLILGEPGTGKELVATALHRFSKRGNRLVTLNCSAIPEGIFESELFGSVKGAFYNAVNKPGKLELADAGTLFLDEIGDMTLALQPKLLRFLENSEVTRLGSTKVKHLDVRVVAATNRDLQSMILEKRFREDLYERLACFTLKIPPLRERKEDIEPLVRYFLDRFSAEYNWKTPTVTDAVLEKLAAYHWPGNVRELRNIVLRLIVQTQGGTITSKILHAVSDRFGTTERLVVESFPTLEEVERRHLEAALKKTGTNISRATRLLGISRATFYRKMKKFNISTNQQNG